MQALNEFAHLCPPCLLLLLCEYFSRQLKFISEIFHPLRCTSWIAGICLLSLLKIAKPNLQMQHISQAGIGRTGMRSGKLAILIRMVSVCDHQPEAHAAGESGSLPSCLPGYAPSSGAQARLPAKPPAPLLQRVPGPCASA